MPINSHALRVVALFALLALPLAAEESLSELLVGQKHHDIQELLDARWVAYVKQPGQATKDGVLEVVRGVHDYDGFTTKEMTLLRTMVGSLARNLPPPTTSDYSEVKGMASAAHSLLSDNAYLMGLPPAERREVVKKNNTVAAPIIKWLLENQIQGFRPGRVIDWSTVANFSPELESKRDVEGDKKRNVAIELRNAQQAAIKDALSILVPAWTRNLPVIFNGSGKPGQAEADKLLKDVGFSAKTREFHLSPVKFDGSG